MIQNLIDGAPILAPLVALSLVGVGFIILDWRDAKRAAARDKRLQAYARKNPARFADELFTSWPEGKEYQR
jgi:hypothetical protein